jgi:hypothetical protein
MVTATPLVFAGTGCGGSEVSSNDRSHADSGSSPGSQEIGSAAPGGSEAAGGGSSSGGTVAVGASGGMGPTAALGMVACGASICPAASQVCCVTSFAPGGPGSSECTPKGQCTDSAALSCSSAASCPKPQVCCFSPSTATAELLAGGTAQCQASCDAGQAQICAANGECSAGQTCQQTGAPIPMACQAAPTNASTRCTLDGGSATSVFGGQCATTFSATCGGTTYQATCACPQGTCACFGASTHVVAFTGCPFCPGSPDSIGPATMQDIVELCGFPQ